MHPRLSLSLLIILNLLAFTPAAQAAEGDAFLKSCTTVVATPPCAGGTQGGRIGAAVSPDGRMMVMSAFPRAAGEPSGVFVYARNPDSGEVTPQGCFSRDGSGGCTTIPQISYAYSPTFSPDGTSLYWPSIAPDSLVVFTRDAAANTLAYSQCWGFQAGCTMPVGTFQNIYSVAADNSTVYVRGGYAITVFTRTGAGTLVQKPNPAGCYVETAAVGCTDVAGVAGPGAIALSGQHLYVTNETWGGYALFTRAGDGSLLQPTPVAGGCMTSDGASGPGSEIECVDGPDYLAGVKSVAGLSASPDGRHVYIGSFGGLFGFSRDASTGLLTPSECLVDSATPPAGCEDGNHTSRFIKLHLTSSGGDLIAGTDNGRLLFFTRAADGQLTQRPGAAGCMSKDGAGGCTPIAGLGTTFTGAALAPNDRDLYAYSSETGFVGWLQRDFAPVCPSVSVDVPFNSPTSVPLACTDFNGDDLVITKGAAPAKGTLADVDQASRTVLYTPLGGMTGSDSFTYFATARGIDSASATASLNLLPEPDADGDGSPDGQDCDDSNAAVAPGKPEVLDNGVDEDCNGADARTPVVTPPNTDPLPIGATLRRAWRPGRRFTRVKTLTVRKAPAKTTVRVRCRGRGCRFKRKRVTVAGGGTAALARFFNFRRNGRRVVSKLRPGTDVIVEARAPGKVGRRWAFEMRKAKPPSLKISALP
jgi:surface antigen